jgi:hypothetical protein
MNFLFCLLTKHFLSPCQELEKKEAAERAQAQAEAAQLEEQQKQQQQLLLLQRPSTIDESQAGDDDTSVAGSMALLADQEAAGVSKSVASLMDGGDGAGAASGTGGEVSVQAQAQSSRRMRECVSE